MEQEVDLLLVSAMLGRAIEDIVYRQLEDLQRQGTISEEATKWIREVSSFTNKVGEPQIPLNFDRIDKDLMVLVQLKQQLDRQLGIDSSDDGLDVVAGPSA